MDDDFPVQWDVAGIEEGSAGAQGIGMDIADSDDAEMEPIQSTSRWIVDRHTGVEQLQNGNGKTFLARFELDGYSTYRKLNLYYPFASLADWQMANFLLTSRLSMRAIDNFLALQPVCLLSHLTKCTVFNVVFPRLGQDVTDFIFICERAPLSCRNAPFGTNLESSNHSDHPCNKETFTSLLS
jgi:hypothetical protein